MTINEALQALIKAALGDETEVSSLDEKSESIAYIAEHWNEIKASISASGGAAPTVDTLGGATDVGKALMKAADREAARTAIAAGTPYTLPAATNKALGGVKQAAAVSFTAEGATAETCAAAIAAVIASLKAAGAMA